ncbi:MAG: chromosomal replication initiator protein DnaA [SAR202 cluster bacterium]|nr:chromosomal replication initiator protein DnaA [SAR202 cluster bacterium]
MQKKTPRKLKLMASGTNQQAARLWQAVLGKIEMAIPRPSFDTWIADSVGVSFDKGELKVSVKDAFTAKYLEERLLGIIETELRNVGGEGNHVTFMVTGERSPVNSSLGLYEQPSTMSNGRTSTDYGTPPQTEKGRFYLRKPELNSRYTFDSFVVGDSNELAYAAAKASSESPGHAFNPLVLYSGVGLGKTHLLHAIGHVVRSQGLECVYTTCEEFTNQYVSAIQQGNTEQFRDMYRSADVLLLDDIQFLIAKEQTQEGFFHTFNALHMANRQIVITSDRPIASLSVLEPRITSRLMGGLVADIQSPPLETRLAILQSKAKQLKCHIPAEVLEFLAQRIQSNIRELEGNLNRVAAWSQFRDVEITIEDVTRITTGTPGQARGLTITDATVIAAVSDHFGIATDQIKGKSRRKMTVLCRQVAMYLLREETSLSLNAIGKLLGGRDHSTVLHGHERVSSRIELDDGLRGDVLKIRNSILGG